MDPSLAGIAADHVHGGSGVLHPNHGADGAVLAVLVAFAAGLAHGVIIHPLHRPRLALLNLPFAVTATRLPINTLRFLTVTAAVDDVVLFVAALILLHALSLFLSPPELAPSMLL